MSDLLAPETAARIDAFYDATLAPRLAAIDDRRRQVRWLIIKSLLVVLPPVIVLIAGDLLDTVLPFNADGRSVLFAWLWLAGSLVLVLVKYLLPGVTAYANYRSRFKQEIVGEIFKFVCPTATYDSVQGLTREVFEAPGLFNTRGAFESDDRMRGRIGGTPFEGSEVGRGYSTGTRRHARSYTVFRGLFFHLDFRTRLTGVTLVEPRQAQGYQLGVREGLSVVAVDDPAFEKEFKVHTSNESEARALLTPVMVEQLLGVARRTDKPMFLAFKDRRAYVAVHYGRTLFEPGVARTTSKEAVREIAGHFALLETIVRELGLNTRVSTIEPDDTLLQGADVEPHPLSRLAAARAGTLTTADVWTLAGAAIDDSAKDGDLLVPRPDGTRIDLEQGPGGLSITYGLGLGFWMMLAISVAGALLASSALRAPGAPAWAAPASAWARTLPSIPWLDAFAANAPTPWLIAGAAAAGLFALTWTGYVRRVVVDPDRIRIYRGLRPFPRVYRRPPYGRAMRVSTSVYIAKSDGLHVMNPTASPMLTEPEARWLTSELKRALR